MKITSTSICMTTEVSFSSVTSALIGSYFFSETSQKIAEADEKNLNVTSWGTK